MKHVIVPLAEGFEEIEAVAVVDILRRAGVEVVVAGVGSTTVVGAHGIAVGCDASIEDCAPAVADAVVLPGGLAGTRNLAASRAVLDAVQTVHDAGRLVAAICAAPTILNDLGILEGKAATSHPAHEDEMDRCDYATASVVESGNVLTSRGAGTAIEFAAQIVRHLIGEDTARDVLTRIVHKG